MKVKLRRGRPEGSARSGRSEGSSRAGLFRVPRVRRPRGRGAVLARLVLRGLAAHRARLALSAGAVVVGVAFVAGTLIFTATLDRSFDHAFADLGRGTDTVVRATKAFDGELGGREAERPVPASALKAVQGADGVAKAHGVVSGFAAVVDRRGRIVGPEPQTGVDWYEDRDLSRTRLVSGTAPAAPDEIAIDDGSAKESGYRIGDRVTVVTRAGTRTFRLAGVFRFGVSGVGSSVAMTAFTPATAHRLLMERPGGYARIDVHAAPGVSQERLRAAVAAVLPPGAEALTGQRATAEQAEPLKDLISAMRKMLLAFALISVFVGSFIIFNTFAMLVAQRTRELALLRAVGASRAQVTRSVLGEAAGVAVAGSTLGIAAGLGLALGLARLMSLVAGEALPFGTPVVPGAALLASYGVGIPVTLAAAYVPARRAARIPPVAALRDAAATDRPLRARAVAGAALAVAGLAAMGAGMLNDGKTALVLSGGGAAAFFVGVTVASPVISRPAAGLLGWPFARFGGAAGRMGRRNAQRDPRQTAATASALTIGLALIATVSVLTQSMSVSVNRQLEAGLTADYRITGRSRIVPVSPEALAAVARVPGVRTAVPIRDARLRLDGEVRTAMAGTPTQLATHFHLSFQSGNGGPERSSGGGGPDQRPSERARGRGAGDVLLVGRSVASAHGWTVGSRVAGEYQDGAKATFRVVGVYDDGKAAAPTVPPMIVDDVAYRRHVPDSQLDRIELTVAPGTDAGAARRSFEAALAPWPNLRLEDRAEIKAGAAKDIDLFLQLVLALLVLSVLVAALGIVNTLALAVVQRTREIGLLRAVGMQRSQLRRMIRYEAVVISVYGAVLGVGTGLVFGVVLQRAMAGEAGMDALAVPYGRLLLYVAFAALIGVLAAVWPARRAARMEVLHAITTA